MALRQDAGPARVHEQRRIPDGQEANRRGSVGIGERRAREVEQLLALLVPEATQLETLERRLDRRRLEAGPVGDVVRRGWAEALEIPPDEQLNSVLGACVFRTYPVHRERIEVGSSLLPSTRRWNPHELEPEPDPRAPGFCAERLDDLGLPARAGGEEFAKPGRGTFKLPLGEFVDPRSLAATPAQGDGERPVVALRDEVDRRSHERALDDAPPLERARKLVAVEPLDTGPETDVHCRRVLRLEPAHALEHAWQGRAHPLEQQLPREQRSVQLPLGQRALGLEVTPHKELLVAEPAVELTHRQAVGIVSGHDLR